MKILFFGLGSIGKRHATLIKEDDDFEIFAYRTKKGQEENGIDLEKEFTNIEEALNINPDIAFITNPTFLHVDTAIKCAEQGIDLFIEKPLSNNLKKIAELKKLLKKNKLFSYVAFNLRFHPVLKKLKEVVNVEDLIYSKTISTSYLPDWRPNQDYRKTFSSDSKKGGGVLLELAHELDYNYWLFGDIEKIEGRYGKISDLEIESEDFGDLMIEHKNGVISDIHLNWFTNHSERKIKLYCDDKYIEGDLIRNQVKIEYKDGETKSIEYDVERNDIYTEQLDYFFEKYRKREKPMNNIEEASKVLKYLIKFKNKNEPIRSW